MPTDFVSVVGVNRSGTTLMRNVLNRHAQLGIADENHYLGHLIAAQGAREQFKKLGPLSDDANVQRLVDFIYSKDLRRVSRFRNYAHWTWLIKNVEKERLVEALLKSDRSERSLFVVFLRAFADASGKSIIGEKTPAHFRYVGTLLEWFPDGKIVHMMRDPRGIFVSDVQRRREDAPHQQAGVFRLLRRTDLPLKIFVAMVTTYAWNQSVAEGLKHQRLHPTRYRLQKFEELVADPERQVAELCRFLEVDFDPQMLSQLVVRGFQKGSAGFDAKAASRWGQHIDPWVERWFTLRFGRRLAELGYD
jgi:Sulfotransferase family